MISRSISQAAIERGLEAPAVDADVTQAGAGAASGSGNGSVGDAEGQRPLGRSVHGHGDGRQSTMRRSVFERYGGFAKVNRVVTSLYEKILDSPVTSPFFEHTDMRQLIDHQTRFIATVMGGPASYTNDHLERVHARHGITEAAFREVCDLLVEALEDEGFADEDIQIVVEEFLARKHYIVTRS